MDLELVLIDVIRPRLSVLIEVLIDISGTVGFDLLDDFDDLERHVASRSRLLLLLPLSDLLLLLVWIMRVMIVAVASWLCDIELLQVDFPIDFEMFASICVCGLCLEQKDLQRMSVWSENEHKLTKSKQLGLIGALVELQLILVIRTSDGPSSIQIKHFSIISADRYFEVLILSSQDSSQHTCLLQLLYALHVCGSLIVDSFRLLHLLPIAASSSAYAQNGLLVLFFDHLLYLKLDLLLSFLEILSRLVVFLQHGLTHFVCQKLLEILFLHAVNLRLCFFIAIILL